MGKASGSLGKAIDSAEQQRRAAEERYRELFENVSIGILRSTPGPEGMIVEANPAAIRIFEADNREQLLGVRSSDLYFDADQRRLISDEIVAKGGIDGMEVMYKTLKGRPIWGRITAIKKTSETGEIYFDNTIEDITERKRAEQSAMESLEFYQTLSESAKDINFICDPAGTLHYFNKNGAAVFGIGVDDLIGKTLEQAFPPEIAMEQRRQLDLVL
ncbi:MAG: PAS domain-containing protein [Methanoregula sp.]|nr:PAS domain-containing protein [Methanoregula sp.]